jgi:hypothetical protein
MNLKITNSVQAVRAQIGPRFLAPWCSVTFYAQLLLGIIGGAGLGIWYTIYHNRYLGWDWDSMAVALFTYFPAIAAAAFIDFQQDKEKYWQQFGVAASVPFAVLFFVAASLPGPGWRFTVAFMASILSIAFWCVANGENINYRDFDPNAPTPPPKTKMQGSTEGFVT